jgi:glutamate formiminotransferase
VIISAINVSEGRDPARVEAIAISAGAAVLDVHADPWHNRSVITVAGEAAARSVAAAAVDALDITTHDGVHPRFGVVDVVPFVAQGAVTMADAIAARDRFAAWAGDALRLPCFSYGPGQTLPDVRKHAFVDLAPSTGPNHPHPTAGACAVGARPPLVAYNLWLATDDLDLARQIAAELRGPAVRALGLPVGHQVQVSCNLIDPTAVGPADVYDRVAAAAPIARAELVGLVPDAVLRAAPEERWADLDLAADRTVEARLAGR